MARVKAKPSSTYPGSRILGTTVEQYSRIVPGIRITIEISTPLFHFEVAGRESVGAEG